MTNYSGGISSAEKYESFLDKNRRQWGEVFIFARPMWHVITASMKLDMAIDFFKVRVEGQHQVLTSTNKLETSSLHQIA